VFPATTGPGAAYGLDGVTATARSHAYAFTAASGFSGTVPVTATDRATNVRGRAFTVERDATPPQVWVSAPAGVISGAFTVTWGAVDAQAGVAWYDLDVSVDGGPWQRILTQTPITNYQYTNPPNTHVTFRVTATDHVSNVASAVARTSVVRVTKYYYHGGARVALRTTGAGGSVVYYLHSDHLGSVSLVTDHASRVVAQQRFLPYGGVRWQEGTFPTDVGFTGHRGHPDLGLVYMRARYYHVALGRFVSADKIVPAPSSPQSLNRYAYVLNSPLRYRDPSGHTPIDICAATRGNAPGCGSGPRYAASTLVNFVGVGRDYAKWSWRYRENVVAGVEALAGRIYGVVQADYWRAVTIARLHGGDPSDHAALSQLWGYSQDDVFRRVMGGNVTFRVAPQCVQAGCAEGVDPGAWAWSRIGALGEVWVNVNAFGGAYAGFAGELNTVHELMHGIDQRGGGVASDNLEAAWATNDLLTAGDGGFAGGFPWQQRNNNDPSEVWADMGLGWTYNRWQADRNENDYRAGVVKSQYMRVNMPRALALAVTGN
jgi:RHS repeat-associated protein